MKRDNVIDLGALRRGRRNRVGALVTDADVKVLHAKLQAERNTLATAVATCTKLAPADKDAWEKLTGAIGVYLGDDPSFLRAGSQQDKGEAYLRELAPWYDKLRAAGCTNLPTPAAPKEESLETTIASFSKLLMWGVAAYLASQFFRRK